MNKKVKTSIYIDDFLVEKLTKIAERKQRSKGWIIRRLLTDSIAGLSLDAQMLEIQNWQSETFGNNRTVLGCVEHIKEELQEIVEDVKVDARERVALELADVFFLWSQLVDLLDVDIQAAIATKLVTNKNRKWKKPSKKGVINHVK